MFDECSNESKYNLLVVRPLTIFSLVWKGAFLLISGVLDVSWWLQALEDLPEWAPKISTMDNNVSQMSLLKFSSPFINSVINFDRLWVVDGVTCNY